MIAFIAGRPGSGKDGQRLSATNAAFSAYLTPEEDAIGDPGEEDDEIDDLLPADLWFRAPRGAKRMTP